jgi:methylase of polypeptide subunit release factors
MAEASEFLKPDGYMLLEIGFDQASANEALIKQSTSWKLLGIEPDLQGIPRVVVLQKLSSVQ